MKVKICAQRESCCYEKGVEAYNIVKEKFPDIEIFKSDCLGVCKAVVAEIDGEIYSELTTESLIELIEDKLKE